jgi:hypothetical protein
LTLTPEPALTEVAEFRERLGTSIDGDLPLVVGGHAVSLWALVYRDRLGSKLDEFFPLLSKDLDLLGDGRMLEELQRIRGGKAIWSGARSPVIGQLKIGDQREDLEGWKLSNHHVPQFAPAKRLDASGSRSWTSPPSGRVSFWRPVTTNGFASLSSTACPPDGLPDRHTGAIAAHFSLR